MRRAAIAALFLMAVCAGGVWLTRDEASIAAPEATVVVVAEPTHELPMAPPLTQQEAASPSPNAHEAPVPMPVQAAEVMPSPFDSSDSPELQYAEAMLYAPDAGADAFLAAGEVYERCLRANPANQWCALGLVTAQRALKSGAPGPNPFTRGSHELRLPNARRVVDKSENEARPAPERGR